MFTSPGILQHYVEFYIHTITMLEKLLSVISFSGSIDHLACRQTTFPTSLSGLGLPSMVRIVAFVLLGCWA
jgi:hypothetical protein